MLKSEIKKIYNFNNVIIPEEILNIEIDNLVIMNVVDRLAKKYLTIEEVYDGIMQGDVIAVSLESNIPTYNKNTQISVGRGFYNKKFEDELIGMKKGDSKDICLGGNPVTTKIVSVKRRMIPAVTDEMVKRENIKDVYTVEEYKKYIYSETLVKLKERKMNEIIGITKAEIINKSEFEFADDDINYMQSVAKMQLEKRAQENNLSYEEFIKEMTSHFLENPTAEESKKCIADACLTRLKTLLIGMYFAKKRGIELDQETYEKDMRARADREKTSVEYIKDDIPYPSYLEIKYTPFINMAIKEFWKDKAEFSIKSIV